MEPARRIAAARRTSRAGSIAGIYGVIDCRLYFHRNLSSKALGRLLLGQQGVLLTLKVRLPQGVEVRQVVQGRVTVLKGLILQRPRVEPGRIDESERVVPDVGVGVDALRTHHPGHRATSGPGRGTARDPS